MNKLVTAAQILAITLLTGCTLGSLSTVNSVSVPSTICHATGDTANPYTEITFNSNDIIPAPANGCPKSPVVINNGKITICHATSSTTNPYNEITVSVNGLDGHGNDVGDIIPAPEGGCPKSPVVVNNVDVKITICHATGDSANPYEELIVNNAELNAHVGHPNDIIQAPVSGCPISPVVINSGKITICHTTGSTTNPYNEITVSVNGLNGHDKHEGDIIPAPEAGCPISLPTLSPTILALINNNNGKITICHATSSKKNPYNEITVSVNGLNGHSKHEGDIIPAPAGGCPTCK